MIGATAFTVWNQSVVNEKVYTVSLTGIALVSWLATRWSAKPDGSSADRLLIMVFLLLGAQFGTLLAGLRGESLVTVFRTGAIIAGVAIAVRLLWVPLLTLVRLARTDRNRRTPPRWKALFLVSWTSMS